MGTQQLTNVDDNEMAQCKSFRVVVGDAVLMSLLLVFLVEYCRSTEPVQVESRAEDVVWSKDGSTTWGFERQQQPDRLGRSVSKESLLLHDSLQANRMIVTRMPSRCACTPRTADCAWFCKRSRCSYDGCAKVFRRGMSTMDSARLVPSGPDPLHNVNTTSNVGTNPKERPRL